MSESVTATTSPVVALVERSAQAEPGREALVGAGVRYSYAGLVEAIRDRAAWLRRSGVTPGDRVGACARNHPDLVVAFLACMELGAVWVGLAPALPPGEKRARMDDAGVRFVLADAAHEQELRAALAPAQGAADAAPAIVVLGAGATNVAPASGPPAAAHAVDAMAPAVIAYTSGSTGSPKGVVHCQAAVATATEGLATLYPPGLRHGACLALTTLNMLMASALVALATRGTCAVTDGRHPREVAAWVRQERVETFPAVATLLYDLLRDPGVAPEDLASLHRPALGGMAVEPELRDGFLERFGHAVSVGYGLSEAPCTVARRLPTMDAPLDSVGMALPHVHVTIRDESDRILGPGETGEICVGPVPDGPWAQRYVPMLGYWHQEELSAAALRGGVLRTGDLGHLDAGGNLFVGGRMDQVIKRAGSNVPAGRVESVVARHPGIALCAAVGVPDPRVGERIVVAFEARGTGPVDLAELQQLAAAALAPFERPDGFVAVDVLPRTANGKVARAELRRLLVTAKHPGAAAPAQHRGAAPHPGAAPRGRAR